MNISKEILIDSLVSELREKNLAIFAGAGLSAGAGYVNWKQLLEPIARELQLDANRETDLVMLAQYHANVNQANRGTLNQQLVSNFSKKFSVTPSHEILARLPISTYWTTNYDKLIERSLEDAGKTADVKHTVDQLAITRPRRDAVVYKMHGDVDFPNDAVLIRDDYEKYHVRMQPFVTALSGDLVAQTFLFLGFSFTDPNLEYILSRVRIHYAKGQRPHYCILKKLDQDAGENPADFEYRQRRHQLFVQELARVGIKTTLIDSYGEITQILREVECRLKQDSVFISGAAHEYGRWSSDEVAQFVYRLSRDLVADDRRIVSGLGLGIGSAVVVGALEQADVEGWRFDSDRLILRAFPQSKIGPHTEDDVATKYREDMLSYAGIALFLFGNKSVGGTIELSSGMREEFAIAKKKGLFLLPVGATGYMAEKLWKEVIAFFDESSYRNGPAIKRVLQELGDSTLTLERIRECVMDILKALRH
jgi:Sir2- and TIR-associating SLOG family/SIR2-like domain